MNHTPTPLPARSAQPPSPPSGPRPAPTAGRARRARRRLLAGVALMLAGWLAFAGWRWGEGEHVNARIEARLAEEAATLRSGTDASAKPGDDASAPAGAAGPLADLAAPEAALAEGIAEARAGHTLEAIAAWRRAGQAADPALAADAWFNTGNLHLRQARAMQQAGGELDRTGALAELAKDAYRRALAVAPAHWPARYNLQRALQWFPDADDDSGSLPPAPARERAVTTMRAFSLGLP